MRLVGDMQPILAAGIMQFFIFISIIQHVANSEVKPSFLKAMMNDVLAFKSML